MLDKFFKTIEKIVPEKYKWVLNHEGFRKYFENTGWMFFGQMFSLLVSFFIGAWLARYLGPENYGVLSYAIAFAGLFLFIASLGIDGVLSRELVNYPEKRDNLLGTSFRLKLIGGILAMALCTISTFIFNVSSLVRLLIILFSFTFIFQSFNVINTYFQAEVRSRLNVKALFFATMLSSLLKVLVILLDKGIIWIVAVIALDLLWQGIALIVVYKKAGLRINNWTFDYHLSKKILKNSWPLMLAAAAGSIYLRIDQVLVGVILGNYEVGLYSAAVKVVEIWYFIPSILCASLFPAIINAKKIGIETYKLRLKNLYLLMIVISVTMAIIVSLLASPIILIIFGSSYSDSINILRIYIWSSVGLFLGLAMGQYLMSENLVKTIFLLNFLAMIVNISLNLILIPLCGLLGSAWATLVSYCIIPIGVIILNKRN